MAWSASPERLSLQRIRKRKKVQSTKRYMSFPTRPRNLSQGSHHLAAWSPATFSPSQSIPSALWTSRPDRRTPAPSQLPWPSPSRRKYRGRCRVGLMSLPGCHHIFFSVFFLLWPPPAHIATTACRGRPLLGTWPSLGARPFLGPNCNPGAGRRWKPKVWRAWGAGHFLPSPAWGRDSRRHGWDMEFWEVLGSGFFFLLVSFSFFLDFL